MNIDIRSLSFPDFEPMSPSEMTDYIKSHKYYKLFLSELNEEFPENSYGNENDSIADYFMCKLIIDKYLLEHPNCIVPSDDYAQNIRGHRVLKDSDCEEMPFHYVYFWNRMMIYQDNYFYYRKEMMFIHNRYFPTSPYPKVPTSNDQFLQKMFS